MTPMQPGRGQSPIRAEVQDPLHRVMREFTEVPPYEFVAFAQRAAKLGVRHMTFIHDYTDSMLNPFQLRDWLEDIPRVLAQHPWTDVERLTAERMLEAAREAEQVEGYLFFEA